MSVIKLCLSQLTLALVLLLSPSHAAINKCVNAAGQISYQDRPCPDSSQAESIEVTLQNAPAALKLHRISAAGSDYLIGLPSHWQVTRQVSGGASTFKAQAGTGRQATRLLMTFIQRQQTSDAMALLAQIEQQTDLQYLQPSQSVKLGSDDFQPVMLAGNGRLSHYVDNKLVGMGGTRQQQFAYVTGGAIVSGDLLINITILSHDIGSSAYAKALAAVHLVTTDSS
ncbi:DUF4124 domain-containing protein [Shewanella sp. Scap07]|uniref:DUF4124 domain-containing protein n=1 Tax=Shewanella sp. Scap07 TaxID=2589987 RepID=UPI0015BAF773|nr:DUF4124 domain-containing protein [Shewanella sp. Scap07]QLE84465.1 DUF4124 domain-containing protein [Shewanella sp. Scap07]